MSDEATHAPADKASWGELFRGEQAIYLALVVLGVVMFSLQILIVVTIMPTVVEEIGGGAWYVWAAMLYQVGTITGAACVGPVWRAIGARQSFVLASVVYGIGTLGCALALDMLTLDLARTVQGLGAGLIMGGTMGIVGRLFRPSQRTRVLAIYQGTWTICSLIGPFFGGAFAEIGWWRGSFWTSLPLALVFGLIAWSRVPTTLTHGSGREGQRAGVPGLRLALLAGGVIGVAEAGQLHQGAAIAGLALASLAAIWGAFRVDSDAESRLFPSHPLSVTRAVGLGYWILIVVGGVQAAVTIFLPLTLQIVHDVTPLLVGVANLIVSTAWTISTFMVSGWSGSRERFALQSGPVFILLSVAMFATTAHGATLAVLFAATFVLGWGIGIHNVHLGARVMGAAEKGEEAVTASSLSMVRSLGGAIGTAMAGMVANVAGLGAHIDTATVTRAVDAVYLFALIPVAFSVLFIVRLTRLVVPRTAPVIAAGE